MEASQALGHARVPAASRGPGRVVVRRRVLAGLALGAPLSALFLYLASRNLDLHGVAAALGRADAGKLALAVASMGLVYVIQAERWRWIARRDAALSARRFLEYVVAGVACNNVIPGRAGDLLRAHWLAGAASIPRARAFATVVVDRSADLLALLAILAIGYPVAEHPAWLHRIDLVAAGLGGSLVLLLVGARLYARRDAIGSGRGRLARFVSGVLEGIAQTVNRRDAFVVGALSLLTWAVWGAGAWLVASSLGIHLSPLEIAFVTAIVNLGVAIPSSPGFIGTYQWLCVAGLGLLAVARTDAFAFSLILQAVWFVPTCLAGLAIAVQKGAQRLQERDGTGEPALVRSRA